MTDEQYQVLIERLDRIIENQLPEVRKITLTNQMRGAPSFINVLSGDESSASLIMPRYETRKREQYEEIRKRFKSDYGEFFDNEADEPYKAVFDQALKDIQSLLFDLLPVSGEGTCLYCAKGICKIPHSHT